MSLACPPWILHEECIVTKGGTVDVPHGNIDIIIGRKPAEQVQDSATILPSGLAVAILGESEVIMTPTASISAKTPRTRRKRVTGN